MNTTLLRRLFIIVLACLPSAAYSAKVVWQSRPHTHNITSKGEPFTSEAAFEIGTFEVGFTPTLANVAQWSERWTAIDRTTYNPITGFFASTVTFADNEAPYTSGRQVYMWGTTGGVDPEWLLVTNGEWEWPEASLSFPTNWQIASASTVIVGQLQASGSPFLMKTAKVEGVTSGSLTPDQWLAMHYDTGELADPSIGHWSSDSDGDGRGNLMEMALGVDPRIREPESEMPYLVDWVEEEGFYYLRLTVSKEAVQQLEYVVEVTGDLKTWQSGTPHTVTLIDDVSTLSVRDTVAFDTSQKRRFIRLTVRML